MPPSARRSIRSRILGLESGRSFSPKVLYVYEKQLEEADVIVINKSDLLDAAQRETLDQIAHSRTRVRSQLLTQGSVRLRETARRSGCNRHQQERPPGCRPARDARSDRAFSDSSPVAASHPRFCTSTRNSSKKRM